MNIVSARCVLDNLAWCPVPEVIEIIRHPDRSTAQWREPALSEVEWGSAVRVRQHSRYASRF